MSTCKAMSDQEFVPAIGYEEFQTPLRNIRVQLDGTAAALDLIPSLIVDRPIPPSTFSSDPTVNALINDMEAGGRPIIEADRMMRVPFEGLAAMFIQEEFVELDTALYAGLESAPKIKNGKGIFPFLLVKSSEWKARLPDYDGGDDPKLQHFKMFSMTCHIDIMGRLGPVEWLSNPDFEG